MGIPNNTKQHFAHFLFHFPFSLNFTMPPRLTALPASSLRLFSALLLAALALARPLAAQSTQSISTAAGSGITIQITNVYNGIPARGYLPLRVSIANTSNTDGRWEVVTQASFSGGVNDRHFGAQATCAVPAHVTQVFEVLAPLPNSSGRALPHVSVHLTGPGVTNGDLQFNPGLQDPPPSALSRTVPVNTPALTRGRQGTTTVISISGDGSNTRTNTTVQPDGTTITEVILTRPDGSTQTTTTTRNANGAQIAPTRVINSSVRSGGASTINTYTGSTTITGGTLTLNVSSTGTGVSSSITRNADGSTTKTTVSPQTNGTTRTESVTSYPDGTSTTTYNIKDAGGNVIQNSGPVRTPPASGTANPAPGTAAPTPPPPAPVRPPGAFMAPAAPAPESAVNGSVPFDTLAALQDSALVNSGLLEKTAPKPGDIAGTSIVKDPITGQVVRTTVLRHRDGTMTTISATPASVGFNVETVVADASGRKISTTDEILLSPQMMQRALPADLSQSGSTAQLPTVDALVNSVGRIAVRPPPSVVLASVPARPEDPAVATPIPNALPRAAARAVEVGAASTSLPPPPPPPLAGPGASGTANASSTAGAINLGLPNFPGSLQSGGLVINNGTVTITGNGIIRGSVTVGNGSLIISNGGSLTIGGSPALNAGTLSLSGSGALVKTGLGNLTLSSGSNVYAVSMPPPPPPPAPPVAPSVRLGGGATFTTGGTIIYSGGVTSIRGGRGFQTIQRQAGSAIFIGLSTTLSQNLGDKIKNYFNTTCARPIQQTTLDTNPDTTQMSSDWRAYLGFDLLFLTGSDWAAAPAGVRTALAYWVAAGGELRLVANADGGLNLPVRQGEHYGAGAIELFTEDDLNNYNFTLEHTDPNDRYLFSLEYKPSQAAPTTVPTGEIPPGFEKRDFTVSQYILMRYLGLSAAVFSSGAATVQPAVENSLTSFFAQAGADFPPGAKLTYDLDHDKVTITNTQINLDVIARLLSNYGAPDGVVVASNPAAPANPPAAMAAPEVAAPNKPAKPPVEIKRYADEAPHLGNHYLLVATVILCFGILVGPLNLFWFCNGPRRPHLLWVTPLLAIAASAAIVAFILLAEGVGGRGIYYRITQLVPDGKVAVESEVESAVTGLLTHRDFLLPQPAWVLDYNSAKGDQEWDRGDFMQSGPHYQGDWFVSRREQTLVARSVVATRAALRVASGGDGKPPVMTSEYNDWMQNLFYMDNDGHYWKLDKISDGKPTPLLPATEDEFKSAWNENLRAAPDSFVAYLRKLAPRPGTFFALGNGSASALEPDYTGLRWNRFRHLITGPVVQ